MKKEMLINVLQPEEIRIAILEDGVLEELYVERTSHESYVGNVYKGRIVNIEPSIQAAFVDFGVGRNGFLHVSDVEPAYYRHLEQGREPSNRRDRGRGEPRGRGDSRGGRGDSRGGRGGDSRGGGRGRGGRRSDYDRPREEGRGFRGPSSSDDEPDRDELSRFTDLGEEGAFSGEEAAYELDREDDFGPATEEGEGAEGEIIEGEMTEGEMTEDVSPVAEEAMEKEWPVEHERDEMAREDHLPRESAPPILPGDVPEESRETHAARPEIDEAPRVSEEPVAEQPSEPAAEEAPKRGRRKSTGGTRGRTRKTKAKEPEKGPESETDQGEDRPRPMESAERRTDEEEPEGLFGDEDLSFSMAPPKSDKPAAQEERSQHHEERHQEERHHEERPHEHRHQEEEPRQREEPAAEPQQQWEEEGPFAEGPELDAVAEDDFDAPPPPARQQDQPYDLELGPPPSYLREQEQRGRGVRDDRRPPRDDRGGRGGDRGGRDRGGRGRDDRGGRGRDDRGPRGRDDRGPPRGRDDRGPRGRDDRGGRGREGGRDAGRDAGRGGPPRGGRGGPMLGRPKPLIQDIFRRGQEVLVQVIKEGIGTKGPTLSTYISIAGRYLVLMPGLNRIGVSRKIADEETRRRLRDIMRDLQPPPGLGFIIRTAGQDRNRKELQSDLIYLSRLWKVVARRITKQKSPCEIYQESDMITRTIRDIFTSDIQTIWVDEPAAYEHAKEFLEIVMPRYAERIKLWDSKEPMFHKHGIDSEINRIQQRHVPLPHGGSIVIDQTEALVAIDVNSGNFRADGNAEETAYQMNLHAAREIARQLRLRDLGGVIVNDFIDMREDRHRRNVERALRDAVARDRARTKILRISQFGIIEMTRQRIRPSLKRSVFTECPHCKATGQVKTCESMSIEVMRLLQLAVHRENYSRIEVHVQEEVAHYLLNRKRAEVAKLEEAGGKAIFIRGVASVSPEHLEFMCQDLHGNEVKFVPFEETRPLRRSR